MTGEVVGRPLLERVTEFLAEPLVKVDEILVTELESTHPYVTDILAHVSRFRGKQLRPILLLLSGDACGGIEHDHLILAAVVEMIHTATLVHDDVLDEAATRRHVATVNARWNNETSVLFGDYLFTHAFHLASSLSSTFACREIGRATNIVCEGELTQIRERGNLELTEEQYFRIIDAKTAELCAVSCRLGARYSGAEQHVVEALTTYGRNLGMAFQIADDILDLLGDESETGKSLGSDLDKQKLTLPLIRLLETSSPEEADRFRQLLSQPDGPTHELLEQLVQQTDAVEYSQACANRLVTDACAALQCLPDSRARQILIDVAEFSIQRNF